jgi:hypothetical protein
MTTFWTVTPHFGRKRDVGPFDTFEAAREFAWLRCLGQASVNECRVRLVTSSEITSDQFERLKQDPPRDCLIDPADLTRPCIVCGDPTDETFREAGSGKLHYVHSACAEKEKADALTASEPPF